MRINDNNKSLVMDGLLLAAVMTLLSLLLNLLITPIYGLGGNSGLLVYALFLLAVCMYCLDRSLVAGFHETQRAWYGALGGLISWIVISLADQIGNGGLTHQAAVIWLIFMGLVVSVLWRRVLPIGARFFFTALMMSWVVRFVLVSQELLANWLPVFENVYRFSGYVGIFGMLVSLVWLVLRARQRIQRMWTAQWVWFFSLIALSVFFGRLI